LNQIRIFDNLLRELKGGCLDIFTTTHFKFKEYIMKNRFLFFCLLLVNFVLLSLTVQAAKYYWTGAEDSDFENPANWVTGSESGPVATTAPANTDYSDQVYFVENNPATRDVQFTKTRAVSRFYFIGTSGWTFNGSYTITTRGLQVVDCDEGNVATFSDATLKHVFAGDVFTINAGSYVYFKNYYIDGTIAATFTGGGTFIINQIQGWSQARSIRLTGDTTLVINSSAPFSPAVKYIAFESLGSKLQYKTTVAAAESLFETDIDNTSDGSKKLVALVSQKGYEFAAKDIGDGFVEVGYYESNVPVIEFAEIEKVNNSYSVTGLVSCTMDYTVAASVSDGTENPPATFSQNYDSEDTEFSIGISNFAANTTYEVEVIASSFEGDDYFPAGSLYTGPLTLDWVSNASEDNFQHGTVTVSRAQANNVPLEVYYKFTGSGDIPAVAGVNYQAPSGVIEIPAGAESAVIEIVPYIDNTVNEDTTMTVSLLTGNYELPAVNGVDVVIEDYTLPGGYNVWVATEESDGLASTASNWSEGRVPADSDNIMLSSFSDMDMTWDGGVNGLSMEVASWAQEEEYTGTVTFKTTFDQTFPVFTISGDCVIEAGTWTHPGNGSSDDYRLKIAVGGDFSLSSAASINLDKKGRTGTPSGRSKGVYAGGNNTSLDVFGNVYEPTDLGVGGDSIQGGGALYLAVDGDVTLNGTISTISSDNTGSWTAAKAGSGGSVYIKAASIDGTGSINASAPLIDRITRAPSGGRIALILTGASSLGLPIGNITAYGAQGLNDGATNSGSSGAGTIFVKTAEQTYGTLYIKNRLRSLGGTYGLMYPSVYGTTQIPADTTWTFDAIIFSEAGVLLVPPTATLVLPNGFASVSGPTPAVLDSMRLTSGILYYGGTIDVGVAESHVLQGGWVFDSHSDAPYTFQGDVTVKDGAAIGQLRFFQNPVETILSDIRVEGSLTVESSGYLYARGTGYSHIPSASPGMLGGSYSHGGQIGYYGVTNNTVYGSILNPVLPGTYGLWNDSANQYLGGGALKVTVSDELILNGLALSDGAVEGGVYNAHGAGGSLNITAGSLTGSGSMMVDGFQNTSENPGQVVYPETAALGGKFAASAGGRIAVRLTDPDADFPEDWISRITSKGCKKGNSSLIASMSSAGTVYLQDGTTAEGAGTVFIRNLTDTSLITDAWTPLPSTRYGGEEDDLDNVSVAVADRARVFQTVELLKLESLSCEEDSFYDLRGNDLFVKSLSVAGANVPAGTYFAANAAVSACFQDTLTDDQLLDGTITVMPDSTTIVIR
jgi:hypothetical protein